MIALAKNPQNHQQTKHIDVRHYYIHEKVENRTIAIKYLLIEQMIANSFIKSLLSTQQCSFAEGLGLE